jgi:hypothetical protein
MAISLESNNTSPRSRFGTIASEGYASNICNLSGSAQSSRDMSHNWGHIEHLSEIDPVNRGLGLSHWMR